ncbi:hypothetical protein P8452_32710 [Trifolium repens]|nr:hypothetical protein P8452_32710 [Trifolium repens]
MSFASAILRSIWFGGLKIPNSIRRDSIISSIRFALDRCSPRFVSPWSSPKNGEKWRSAGLVVLRRPKQALHLPSTLHGILRGGARGKQEFRWPGVDILTYIGGSHEDIYT